MRIDVHVLGRGLLLAVVVMFGGLCVETARGQEIQLRGVTGGGLNFIQPGRWGLVKAWVENSGEAEQSLAVSFHFTNPETGYQFVRETWVPAGARRRVVWPARLDEVHRYGEPANGEVLAISPNERKYDDSQALLAPIKGRYPTAFVRSPDRVGPEDGVLAVRRHRGLAERLVYPVNLAESMPRYTLGWEPIDVLVLCDPAIELDAGHCRALRRWLRAGGTVWVMANEMPGAVAARLFDESWDIAEIDQVSFNNVTIDAADPSGAATGETLSQMVSESPVDMARITPGGFDVHATVRGWPALLSRKVGRGRLVVTTLGWSSMADENTDAWRERIADLVYPNRGMQSQTAAVRPAMSAAVTDPYIRRHVAYRVAGRWLVGGVLLGFAAVMVLSGVWFIAIKRGELAAVAWLVLVVVASGALLGIGIAARSGVGQTNAQLQVVHTEPGTVAATVEGAIGLFAPSTRNTELTSRAGGWAWPREAGGRLSGDMVRLRWADLDHWRWQNLEVAGGTIRMLEYQTPIELAEAPRLRARFDERGLVGSFHWPTPGQPQDLVIVTGGGALAVSPTGRGGEGAGAGGDQRFTAGADAALPDGTFVGGGVLADTQRHRNDALRAMSASGDWPARPMLAGWTERIDGGLSDEQDVLWRGGALWLTALRLEPSVPGQKVTVPAAFVERQAVTEAPGVTVLRTLFDPTRREWIPSRQSGAVVSRFTWPRAVGMLEIEAARFHVDIAAPGRTVRIVGFRGEGAIELASRQSPDGRWEVELPVDRLPAGPTGSLEIGIDVGPLDRPAGAAPTLAGDWQLEGMGLEVSGRVASQGGTPASVEGEPGE